LKKSKEKLEKEVQQRTWDLQEANVILEEQHAELQQQKEEIVSQKEILEKQNMEITKQRDEVTKHRNEIKQKNLALQNQNAMITESITYAKTLQQHMLPVKSFFDQNFHSFLLYLPKNIVSGDFYWYTEFNKPGEFLVALVDCTGHGVPGAFMTIMGIDLINNIVNQQNIKSPSKIVEKLDQGIIETLNQETSDNLDGMDLIFCKVKKTMDKYFVSFVGANRPFIYYSKANNSLKVIKGWAKTVGGVFNFVNHFSFNEKHVELNSGDTIYLTSDGFADQLNNYKEKYGSKNLYNNLGKIATLDLDEQKRILEQELKNHQQTAEQYDDVTIWGIKLK
jgi:serine phosphatase RsbU (regulator of sigma subunit)